MAGRQIKWLAENQNVLNITDEFSKYFTFFVYCSATEHGNLPEHHFDIMSCILH